MSSPAGSASREELVGRLLAATTGALEILHVYVGDKLGLYRALIDRGPMTPAGLAAAAGIDPRYSREWLEQQAVAGILVAGPGPDGDEGRSYALPPGHGEVLADGNSVFFVGALAQGVASIGAVMPAVLEAFRSGSGVPYEAYGVDMRESISRLNRPGFIKLLGSEWFPAISEIDARLRIEPAARVADLGCGTGWSSIGIAKAYPLVRVDGFDLDAPSIGAATRNAEESAVADRVRFEVRDAADPALAGSYDLVAAFETIHDMSNPVGALRAMRGLVREGGFVLVVDEKVADAFSAPGDELERLMYGWSALHCLPVGIEGPSSAATGTVMRPATLRRYALEAGFSDLEVLPVSADLWRFYRLV